MAVSPVDQAMIGKTYNRLLAVEALGDGIVKFRCSCGTIVSKIAAKVRFGHTKSCGCLYKEALKVNQDRFIRHGKTGSRVHVIWSGMMSRCYVPNEHHYERYGGRGITVEQNWHIFENFYSDMGDPPDGYSLERRDNSKGYSKENCKWATIEEQSWNKRNSVAWEINGVCYRTTKDAMAVTGLSQTRLTQLACGRFNRGKWYPPNPGIKKIFRGRFKDEIV